MQKVFIVKTDEGYVIAEATNYTYGSEEGARAFARDKWGDENPTVVTDPLPDTTLVIPPSS
jgi:hypothetical protein